MKVVLWAIVLLMAGGRLARAQEAESAPREFADVPLESWAYPALAQLIEMGELERKDFPYVARGMTRYEFAVPVFLWQDKHPNTGPLTQGSKAQDIMTALGYEFAPEVAKVPERIAELDRRTNAPRYPMPTPWTVPFLRRAKLDK